MYGSGYWADHWEYYLDLIEAYTCIYPDGEEGLMYNIELPHFFSTATVKARSNKYVMDYLHLRLQEQERAAAGRGVL